MADKEIDLAKLAAPFFPEQVHWRLGQAYGNGQGRALAYIDARDVYNRLDAVCGPSNWQCRYPIISEGKTVCEIGIRINGEWIWKANTAGNTDIEGEKGAGSDAIKRAAVCWDIGRYLYELDSPRVKTVVLYKRANGKEVYGIDQNEMPRLQRLLTAKGTVRQKPQPEWKCETTRAELQKQLRALSSDIAACSDHDSLIALENESKQLIEDCREHLPAWFHGDGGDSKGLKRTLEERHAEFMNRPVLA